MNEFYINHYELKELDYVGIYVFLTDRVHKKGDPISLENMDCLCWIIYPERIKSLLRLNADVEKLCKLEIVRFKDEADDSIEELQKKSPRGWSTS